MIPGREDPLEKGMAPHSSIHAWRIQWTEEPGGLQSVESKKQNNEEITKQEQSYKQKTNRLPEGREMRE